MKKTLKNKMFKLFASTITAAVLMSPFSAIASAASYTIKYGSDADSSVVSKLTVSVLEKAMKAAKDDEITVTSTLRTARAQAEAMYANLERTGADEQKAIYGDAGDKVIDVYVKDKKAKKSKSVIISNMESKINEVGPGNVSKHCGDPAKLNVVDVAHSSISNKTAFYNALKADPNVSKVLDENNCYHVEVKQ